MGEALPRLRTTPHNSRLGRPMLEALTAVRVPMPARALRMVAAAGVAITGLQSLPNGIRALLGAVRRPRGSSRATAFLPEPYRPCLGPSLRCPAP
jgi:hypothetical protein